MLGGILPIKLGRFRNSKSNFKEYSRKNEIKIMKNNQNLKYFEKNIKNSDDWKVQ